MKKVTVTFLLDDNEKPPAPGATIVTDEHTVIAVEPCYEDGLYLATGWNNGATVHLRRYGHWYELQRRSPQGTMEIHASFLPDADDAFMVRREPVRIDKGVQLP
jgi:hypothetical protein